MLKVYSKYNITNLQANSLYKPKIEGAFQSFKFKNLQKI